MRTVIYQGASDEQVNWGGGADPRGVLALGNQYEVAKVEVHSMHTRLYLDGFPGMWFNSVCFAESVEQAVEAHPAPAQPPLDMILYCPNCGKQHVDESLKNNRMHSVGCNISCGVTGGCSCGFDSLWDNPPHRSHLCSECGCIWRPADVPTNGVEGIKTEGKADTWPVNSEDVFATIAKQAEPAQPRIADPFTYIIQHLNSSPDAMTKDECVEMVTQLRDRYSASTAAINEADRRAGAAERELARAREELMAFRQVRARMKRQWGVDDNVSFDTVWGEAMKLKAQQVESARKEP